MESKGKKLCISLILFICSFCLLFWFATILWGRAGGGFSDFDTNSTQYEEVMLAVSNGAMAGLPDGSFQPEQSATYAEIEEALWKTIGAGTSNLLKGTAANARGRTMEKQATRSDAAVMLVNAMQAMGKETPASPPEEIVSDLGILEEGANGWDGSISRADLSVAISRLARMLGLWQTSDTTFAFLGDEDCQAMMDRINAATPAYRSGFLANGLPITKKNIQSALAAIQDTCPTGTAWTNRGPSNPSDKYRYDSAIPYYDRGGGRYKGGPSGACNSFAAAVSDAVFGEDAPAYRHTNFAAIKTGDIVRIVDPESREGHVVVIVDDPYISISGEKLAPQASGNVAGHVLWYDDWGVRCVIDVSTLIEQGEALGAYVISRY